MPFGKFVNIFPVTFTWGEKKDCLECGQHHPRVEVLDWIKWGKRRTQLRASSNLSLLSGLHRCQLSCLPSHDGQDANKQSVLQVSFCEVFGQSNNRSSWCVACLSSYQAPLEGRLLFVFLLSCSCSSHIGWPRPHSLMSPFYISLACAVSCSIVISI